jgi:hypothetical protein
VNVNTNLYNSSIFVPDGTDGDSTGFFATKLTVFTLHPLRIEVDEEEKYGGGVCPVPTASATLFIHAKPWGVKSEAKTPAGCLSWAVCPG